MLVGALGGETSPAPTYTPLVGAELTLAGGADAVLPLDPSFEYGVLVAQGSASVDGVLVERNAMSYLGGGRRSLEIRGGAGDGGADTVVMLLGGEPFEEEIVMWWNFIGRSHEEVVEQREAWNGTAWPSGRSGSARSRTSRGTGCWPRRCRTSGCGPAAGPAEAGRGPLRSRKVNLMQMWRMSR